MSRYLERAENTIRQLDVTMSLMLDPGATAEARWQRLIASLGGPVGLDWQGDLDGAAQTLVFDLLNPASIIYCITAARENARQIREELSSEQWQRLNRLYHQIHADNAERQFRAGMSEYLAATIDGIHLFKGISDSTMIHGEGWQFIRLGRYLERAYATATLLEVYEPGLLDADWAEQGGMQYLTMVGMLRCCTSFEAYCQVFTAEVTTDKILKFLLLNHDFPHAIRYCVDGIRQSMESIQKSGGRRPPEELTAVMGRLHAMLGYTTIGEILSGDARGFLHSIREQCLRIHELFYQYYVSYSIQSALAV
jgi:uncharacterized alpha-E superfamily protein